MLRRVVGNKVSCLICYIFFPLQPVCHYPSVICVKKKLLSLLNLPWNTKNESFKNKKEFTVPCKLRCQCACNWLFTSEFSKQVTSKVYFSFSCHTSSFASQSKELATSVCRINVFGRTRRKAKPVSDKAKLGWFWFYEEGLPVEISL